MMESGKALEAKQYRGTVDCGKKILSKEGVTGFFKGNLSNFWRSIGSSLVLVLYDELQNMFAHQGHWYNKCKKTLEDSKRRMFYMYLLLH